MSNMSYCRFENTHKDLLACEEHLYDDLEGSEAEQRDNLVAACKRIASEVDDE